MFDTIAKALKFLWELLTKKPRFLAIALLFVLAVYIVGRVAGYDVIPPLLDKIGVNTFPRSVDITGKWKYRCIAAETNYQHGGTCDIEEHATPYGIEWRLSGHRRWIGSLDANGKLTSTDLNPP